MHKQGTCTEKKPCGENAFLPGSYLGKEQRVSTAIDSPAILFLDEARYEKEDEY